MHCYTDVLVLLQTLHNICDCIIGGKVESLRKN